MGRAPCCDKANVKKGPWSPEEDMKLKQFVEKHGTGGNWISLPHKAGLKRCGKSCRLRWLNYLRPNIKHGEFSDEEDRIICSLFSSIGSRWSIIASQLPGRTDNDIKNYWNTKLKKKLLSCAPAPSQRGVRPHQYRHQQQQQQNQLQVTSPSSPTSQGIGSNPCCYTSASCPTTLTDTAHGIPTVITEGIFSTGSSTTTLPATVPAALMAIPNSYSYDQMTYQMLVDPRDRSGNSSDGRCTQLMHAFGEELGYESAGARIREQENCFHCQVDQAPLPASNYDQEITQLLSYNSWYSDDTNYSGIYMEHTMSSNGERRMAYNF